MNALTEYRPDQPLRLDTAAQAAFPDGSMTASGLRKEAGRGNLVISRIAGKDYTTLADIAEMRQKCQLPQKDRASGSARLAGTNAAGSPARPFGSSATANTSRARDAALTIVRELKSHSRPTSTASKSPARRKAPVIHLKSRSQQ